MLRDDACSRACWPDMEFRCCLGRWRSPHSTRNEPAFLAVSAILAGRQSLDVAQARRLYDALVADDPGFPASVRALLALITSAVSSCQSCKACSIPSTLHWRLCRAGSFLPGFSASSEKESVLVVIAFETALNAVIVEDVLKPPTYCYGVYGSWAKKPA